MLKRKNAWLALGLMVALVLPLSAVSPLPVQEVRAEEVLVDAAAPLAAAPAAENPSLSTACL